MHDFSVIQGCSEFNVEVILKDQNVETLIIQPVHGDGTRTGKMIIVYSIN